MRIADHAVGERDPNAVKSDAGEYILGMQPMLEAFDQIDPSVQHV